MAGDIYQDATVALEVLQSCRAYFEDRADAEYFPDSPQPVANEEMRLLTDIERAIRGLCGVTEKSA